MGEDHLFNSQFQYIWNLVVNHKNYQQEEILVAAFGGILRSTDGGKTWTVVLGKDLREPGFDLNTSTASYYSDLAIASDGIFYATLSEEANNRRTSKDGGIYRSEDGVNWINITPENWPEKYRRTVIGTSPSKPNVVYFLCDSDPANLWKFTFLEKNHKSISAKWENLSNQIPDYGKPVGDFETQKSYNMIISVKPDDPEVVFIGATNLYRSTDGFSTEDNTQWIGGYDTENNGGVYNFHYVDQHSIVFYPSDPRKMLTGNDGGVQINYNNLADKVTWNSLNNGYVTSQFYTIAVDQSRVNDFILGGMQDNGSYITGSANPDIDWERILGGDGGYCAVSENGYFFYFSFQKGQIYRTTLNESYKLTSFARVDPVRTGLDANDEFLFINPFVLDPNNNHIMYLAGGNKIWRNDNLAQIPSGSQQPTRINWASVDESSVSGTITALNVSTNPANIVYYGTSHGELFKIVDAKNPDYQVINLDKSKFPENGYISCIAVDPTNADHLMVIFSNYNVQSIFVSYDGGISFESAGGNLEENPDGSGNGPSIRWGVIIPLINNKTLYVTGTSTGVYSTTLMDKNNTIWAKEAPEVIGNVVVPMVTYRPLDGLVAVATHGNGVFTRKYSNVMIPSVSKPKPEFSVSQNYPNPFGSTTTFSFTIPETNIVKVSIFNNQGQEINTLLWQVMYPGENKVTWDGTDSFGTKVKEGIYYCRFQYNGIEKSRRILYQTSYN